MSGCSNADGLGHRGSERQVTHIVTYRGINTIQMMMRDKG